VDQEEEELTVLEIGEISVFLKNHSL